MFKIVFYVCSTKAQLRQHPDLPDSDKDTLQWRRDSICHRQIHNPNTSQADNIQIIGDVFIPTPDMLAILVIRYNKGAVWVQTSLAISSGSECSLFV